MPIALLVTLGIFLFMQRLISVETSPAEKVELAAVVALHEPPPDVEEIEPPPEPEEVVQEPSMDSVSVSENIPSPSPQVDAPNLQLSEVGIDIGPIGDGWQAPVVGGGGLEGLGSDNSGYVEVVPYATRSPAIPEIAWRNKVNGWVLVVFNVDRDGRTKNIRVLDANPRGIYEEAVVFAVSHWRYAIKGIQDYRGDMVLTQKLELSWEDYNPDKALW